MADRGVSADRRGLAAGDLAREQRAVKPQFDDRPRTGYCPVHEHELRECSDFCLPERIDLESLQSDYHQYWYDRRRGLRPRR